MVTRPRSIQGRSRNDHKATRSLRLSLGCSFLLQVETREDIHNGLQQSLRQMRTRSFVGPTDYPPVERKLSSSFNIIPQLRKMVDSNGIIRVLDSGNSRVFFYKKHSHTGHTSLIRTPEIGTQANIQSESVTNLNAAQLPPAIKATTACRQYAWAYPTKQIQNGKKVKLTEQSKCVRISASRPLRIR